MRIALHKVEPFTIIVYLGRRKPFLTIISQDIFENIRKSALSFSGIPRYIKSLAEFSS